MDNRRDFLKKASFLAAGTGLAGVLPISIQRAMAINPELHSTYLDAEHVVILMQENRSFDHCYGSLQGVRGFNDPRAISLPDKNVVWMQTSKEGETYLPFRLNIKDTNATWIGSLPHGWDNQTDARNNGRFDKWLDVKHTDREGYGHMPLTMGYYNREDIPFYYSLADAFTVCDQNFCSSLTGTTPNRLYLWTGTIREEQHEKSRANVWNSQVDYPSEAKWATFPERLEDAGISWKIYQNQLSVGVGMNGEEDVWLSNFSDNPIEFFSQYNVRFLPAYVNHLHQQIKDIPGELTTLQQKLSSLSGKELEDANKDIVQKQAALQNANEGIIKWSPENYAKLSQREKALHEKAFSTNIKEADYHNLVPLTYQDGSNERTINIPKGDVLYQFREDVQTGKLPLVSWIVAPEAFSDHPSSPWFGAWYVSEVMDILTKDPAVWKKTIFILCYDENDGYFDHVPPFTAPHPDKPETGATSKGLNSRVDYVTLEEDLKVKPDEEQARESAIGLGFRVPLVVASPWSRGGAVCSEVFDHTSIIQFMEKFLTHKTGKPIKETNISDWRRTICGDLSSVFTPFDGERMDHKEFVAKEAYIESVHKAKFKQGPHGFKKLTAAEAAQISQQPYASPLMPRQEKGIRKARPLPYQLHTNGKLSDDKKEFILDFEAGDELFGKQSAGAPFNVYAPGKYLIEGSFVEVHAWAFAVAAGNTLSRGWPLNNFENNQYHLKAYGPNGFFREFIGTAQDPSIDVSIDYELNNKKIPTGNIVVKITNHHPTNKYNISLKDNAYKTGSKPGKVAAGSSTAIVLDLSKNFGWYDISIGVQGAGTFEKRYAGHVETGKASFTDPAMGNII